MTDDTKLDREQLLDEARNPSSEGVMKRARELLGKSLFDEGAQSETLNEQAGIVYNAALRAIAAALSTPLVEQARNLIFESLYHLRIDAAAEQYHAKAQAFLNASPPSIGDERLRKALDRDAVIQLAVDTLCDAAGRPDKPEGEALERLEWLEWVTFEGPGASVSDKKAAFSVIREALSSLPTDKRPA